MQKEFIISRLEDDKMRMKLKTSLIIAYRANDKIHHQNLCLPKDSSMEWNEKTNEFVIRFKLREGECVAAGDVMGMAKKGILK